MHEIEEALARAREKEDRLAEELRAASAQRKALERALDGLKKNREKRQALRDSQEVNKEEIDREVAKQKSRQSRDQTRYGAIRRSLGIKGKTQDGEVQSVYTEENMRALQYRRSLGITKPFMSHERIEDYEPPPGWSPPAHDPSAEEDELEPA